MKTLPIITMTCALFFAALATAQSNDVANANQADVKGCLSGDAGSYTLTEDQTGASFTIAGSSVDLKPHLGHEVELIAQVVGKGNGRSIKVTELRMISEHCSAAAASNDSPNLVASAVPPSMPGKNRHMPKTATPLPLLGAFGLALLMVGLLALRKPQARFAQQMSRTNR